MEEENSLQAVMCTYGEREAHTDMYKSLEKNPSTRQTHVKGEKSPTQHHHTIDFFHDDGEKKSFLLDHPRALKKHTAEEKKRSRENKNSNIPESSRTYTHALAFTQFSVMKKFHASREIFRKNIKFLLLLLDFRVLFPPFSKREAIGY
jgi:hypothetical protein